MGLQKIETKEKRELELPFYLTDPVSPLLLYMFHHLTPKEMEEVPYDYQTVFDEGLRFPPTEELEFLIPTNYLEKEHYLIVFCQLSGIRISHEERSYRVTSPDDSEVLFVCEVVKNWLISSKGWKISR